MVKDKIVEKSEEPKSGAESETAIKPKAKKHKARRSVPQGHIHILASFNNTIISVTDSKGGALSTASAGSVGFKGSKKGTAFAAQMATEKALQIAKENYGLSKASVFVRGIGLGREAALRSLGNSGILVESLVDVTGIPHGGVRARKARRV